MLQIANTKSNRLIDARVTGANTVAVDAPAHLAAR
jgi:hypothetical protein